MRGWQAGLVAGALGAGALGAGSMGSAAMAAPHATAPSSGDTVELTVMTFNIWVGGGRVDFDQVPAAIEASGADIVGVQESGGNLTAIADALGWNYTYEPMQIISRLPIVVPGDEPDVVYVEVAPGEVVAVSNVHLQAFPYGPYDLRDGATVGQVLANETQIHMQQMASRFSSLSALAEQGVPVFLTGDFNVPSHLDWTAETAAATPREFDLALDWPVSRRLDELGFRDSFREIHHDPIAKPGYTWTPGYPPPSMTADEVHDRIDMIYAAGPSVTMDSFVLGEAPPANPLPGDFGGPHADVVVNPWPSDHRAVAATFEVSPAPRPHTLHAADDTVVHGETLELDGYGTGAAGDWVGIWPGGYQPTKADISCRDAARTPSWCTLADWVYLGSNSQTRPRTGLAEATVTFDTSALAPGDWVAHLISAGTSPVLASEQFTVLDPDALPTVSTDQAAYAVGEPIVATFDNAPGGPLDWLGVYDVDEIPDGNPASYRWTYISNATSGTRIIDGSVAGTTWPLPPGGYALHLLLNDGYEIAATTTFIVVAG